MGQGETSVATIFALLTIVSLVNTVQSVETGTVNTPVILCVWYNVL